MNLRRMLVLLVLAVSVALAGFAGWLFSLPQPSESVAPAPISMQEMSATVEALQPSKRPRPVVAIIGLNDATETTDYLMPYGVLKRADVADVLLVSTGGGTVRLYPALSVESELSIAEFERRYPDGADYILVPAMEPNGSPDVLQWLQSQAKGGAFVIGVCAGATVIVNAGLLDKRRATTHWFYLPGMLERHPDIVPVADRRYVVDGNLATTTGISASLPLSLALVEAIAGRQRAAEVAQDLGVEYWDARHHSADFGLTRRFATTVMANSIAFWNRDSFPLPLRPGMDEVVLALQADAWSRTYQSKIHTVSTGEGPVPTRSGALVHPDRVAGGETGQSPLPAVEGRPAMQALDENLEAIAVYYGRPTADVVAMQLEYRWLSNRPVLP